MTQQLLNGVFRGSIYALFALGYTLVFGILDILNLAHQAVFMLAAFVALALISALHLNLALASLLAVVAAGLIGVALERTAFRPLRGRADSRVSSLISSIAAATILESIALGVWGPDVTRFPLGVLPAPGQEVGIPSIQLVTIGVSIAMTALLTWMLQATRLGRQIRATAENPTAARVLGVNVDRAIAASFFISSALGGVGGVLFGLAFNASPDMGRSVQLKGLAVIVLGGMGSVPGAVLAGYALGLIEVFTVAQIGSSWSDAASFAVLFLVLLVRPRGLFGRSAARLA